MTKYQVIYADPPWRYRVTISKSRRVENHYPTMPVEDICDLRIPCADDSILFLWATVPLLPEAGQVMNAWGFEYRTNAVWNKMRIGMGYWVRGQCELLLIGTRGQFPLATELCAGGIYSEKRTKHSKKPAFFRELITSSYPNESKLEMFARDVVPGWDAWGNEVDSSVQIDRLHNRTP
jgi:N6-adenosine-specific RNA methylase IME4